MHLKIIVIVIVIVIALTILSGAVMGQRLTQTVKGRVTDKESQTTLPGANIVILGTDPLLGSATGPDGNYVIKNVPVGRYDIRVSFMGYREVIINEVLVGSGKEVVLNVEMEEKALDAAEVIIRPDKDKVEF